MERRNFVKSLAAGAALVPLLAEVAQALSDGLEALRADLAATPDDAAYWARVREEFTALEVVYLNSSTIGATPRSIITALCGYLERLESYPRSYVFGGFPGASIETVRQRAEEFLGASDDEVAITHNTTEGMNYVATGLKLQASDEVLMTDQEHPGGTAGWQYRAQRDGIRIATISLPTPVESKEQILQLVEDHLTPNTRVCSFCHIMTETGLQMPLAEIAAITRPRGILLVCDGAHAPGMLQVDVKALGVDTYASSSHKWMLAPKGSGLLYISKEVQDRIQPVALSGGYWVYSGASGTPNTPHVLAHGDTMAFHNTIGRDRVERRVRQLQAYLRTRLTAIGATPLVPDVPELSSGVTSYAFRSSTASTVAAQLKRRGIDVKAEPRNSLRISTHIFNSEEEIDRLTDELTAILGTTHVNETGNVLPKAVGLQQNYPNPFNASTQIRYELPADGNARLEILDALGQIVDVPFRGWQTAGRHELLWSAGALATGVYLCRLVTDEETQTRKMELVR